MKIPNIFNADEFYRNTNVDYAGQFLIWLSVIMSSISLAIGDFGTSGFGISCIILIFVIAKIMVF